MGDSGGARGLRRMSTAVIAAVVVALSLSACSNSGEQPRAEPTSPRAVNLGFGSVGQGPAVDRFTDETGIKLNYLDEGDEENADIIWVDATQVGKYAQEKSLLALNDYLDLADLKSDMPLLPLFTVDGEVLALPDAAFLVTTWNSKIAAEAGITTTPTTLAEYTRALKQAKDKGVVADPLNSPFDEPNRLWYMATAAFGGSLFDASAAPAFSAADSAGYRGLEWMVKVYRDGLVPTEPVNAMYGGRALSMLADYPMQGFYDKSSSSIVGGQVDYVPTPGVNGPVPNPASADGLGVPSTAKNRAEAVEFLKWYTSTETMAEIAAPPGYEPNMPGRISSAELLVKSGRGQRSTRQLIDMMRNANSRWITPNVIPPPWFPEFESAAIPELQAAITGKQTVRQTIDKMAAKAQALRAN